MSSVLITGTARGIGRATALELARRGHRVIATSRDPGPLAELPVDMRLKLDVTDARSIELAIAAAGSIDVLISNAGVIFIAPIETTPLDELERLLRQNTIGALRVAQAVLPAMRERGSGRMLFVSSVLGRITLPTRGAYAATKWALEALVETMASEVAHFGVEVALLEPGAVSSGALDARLRTSATRRSMVHWNRRSLTPAAQRSASKKRRAALPTRSRLTRCRCESRSASRLGPCLQPGTMLRISHPSRSGASRGENDGCQPNRSEEMGMTDLPTSPHLATSDDAVGNAAYPIAGPFRLADGRLVWLRPLQAEDAPRLMDLCKRLSPSTLRRRFLRSVVRCDPLEAQRLAAVDQVQRVALVAVPDPAEDSPIVAVGRFPWR